MAIKKTIGLTRRIPVQSEGGEPVGWVIFDGLAEVVNLEGRVYIPAQFTLRFPGSEEQPSLTISYAVRDRAPVVTGVNVEAKPSGRRVLRKDFEIVAEKLHEWSDMAVKAVMQAGEETETSLSLGVGRLDSREANRAASVGRKRANRKINDAFLREVAKLYEDNAETGRYAAIMERFNNDSEATVARWVGKARKRGFLPPTTEGKGNNG